MLTYLGKSNFPAAPVLPAGARAAGHGTGNSAATQKMFLQILLSSYCPPSEAAKSERFQGGLSGNAMTMWVWNNPSQRCWVVLQLLRAFGPPEHAEAAPNPWAATSANSLTGAQPNQPALQQQCKPTWLLPALNFAKWTVRVAKLQNWS